MSFVWVTQDDRELTLSEITNDHLINILRFLYRKAVREAFMDEEGEWRDLVHPKFARLEREAKRRKLKWQLVNNQQVRFEEALKDHISVSGPITTENIIDAARYLAFVTGRE